MNTYNKTQALVKEFLENYSQISLKD